MYGCTDHTGVASIDAGASSAPPSKAPDRPDFHRGLGFARRFARKGTGNCGSSSPAGTTRTSFSRTATGKLAGGGRRILPPSREAMAPPKN